MSDNLPMTVPAAQPVARAPGLLGAAPAPLARLLDQVPPAWRSRIVPAAIVTGALAATALIWSIVGATPDRSLLPALGDEDKALVAAALDAGGIPYTLDAASGAIAVGEGDYHRARMLLATEGLPKAPPAAGAMLDNLPMGSSRAVEGERLRLARESDLARTIEAMDAIEQARVHLAVEQRSAFVRERAAPAASVMLRLRAGRTLSDAQTDAIVHLVAASVPGLSPDAVSVVDQAGRLLSGPGRDGASPLDRQLRLQSETEERLRQSLVALLTPVVGADNFSAQVNADLRFDERQATRETYPEGDARLAREEGRRETGDAGGVPVGIPGALSNRVPPDPVVAAAPPTPGAPADPAATPVPTNETYARQFQLGREVSVERAATGTVRRLTVAVALANPPGGRPRSAAEIAAIEALVKGAVGFDAARGDVVTVTARRFAPVDAAAAAPWWEGSWTDTAMRAGAALLLILLLYALIVRPLLRRVAPAPLVPEPMTPAMLLAQPDAARRIDGGSGEVAAPVALERIAEAPGWAERAGLVRAFVAQHPDRSADVMHQLLRGSVEPTDG